MRSYSDLPKIEKKQWWYRIGIIFIFMCHIGMNIYLGITYNPGIPVWNIVISIITLFSEYYYERRRKEIEVNSAEYYYRGVDTSI